MDSESVKEFVERIAQEMREKEGLVGQFTLDLEKEGITITRRKGNSFRAEWAGVSVDVSAHEDTPIALGTEGKGWWAVMHSFVEEMIRRDEETDPVRVGWGVVLILGGPKSGYWWIAGKDFYDVFTRPPDSAGKYNVSISVEEAPKLAHPFRSVRDFPEVSGLARR